jgi:hypothetical protein
LDDDERRLLLEQRISTLASIPLSTVEIVLDRRVGPRRQEGGQGGPDERRRTDRRVNQEAQARLQAEGFAVVQR